LHLLPSNQGECPGILDTTDTENR